MPRLKRRVVDSVRRWDRGALRVAVLALALVGTACSPGTAGGGSEPPDDARSGRAPAERAVSADVRAVLDRVAELHAVGRLQDALEEVDGALAESPGNVELLYSRGVLLGSSGDVSAAREAFEAVLVAEPDHLPAVEGLLRVHSDLQQHERALELAERALRLSPDDPDVLLLGARQLNALQRHGEATDWLLRATEDGGSADAWAELGLARVGSEEPAAAEAAFREALRLDAQHETAMLNLGRLLVRQGREAEGQELLDRHAELAVEADAADHLEQAARQGGQADDLTRLGATRLQEGDTAGAIEAFEQAVAIAPDDPDRYLALVDVYLQQGRLGDALRWSQRAIDAAPDDALAHLVHATVLIRMGRIEDARAAIARSQSITPWTMSAWMRLGSAYYQANRIDDALEAYRRAAERSPDDARPWLAMAEVHYFAGDLQEASAAARSAIAADPDNGDAAVVHALILDRMDDRTGALEALRDAADRYRRAGLTPLDQAARFRAWPGAEAILSQLPPLLDGSASSNAP